MENKKCKVAQSQDRERVKDSEQSHLSLLFTFLYVILEILLTLLQEVFESEN